MENIKEKLKQVPKQISKQISKQILSGGELTEVSGGEGVREFIIPVQDVPKIGAKVITPLDFKVEVDKDGFVTYTFHKEMSGREVQELMDNNPDMFNFD